jgi:hypothetical protein
MRLSQTKVLEALSLCKGDLTKDELYISLRVIERTLDNVADTLDNDLTAASLGDASNLVQLIRESI